MKVSYDPETDAMHLVLLDTPVVESEEMRPGVILDYDEHGRVVGMEILHVQKNLPGADAKHLELDVA
ncbi:MAG: DUF2283 domain-containing protein [Phycisphaeraceae bacterium]